MAKLNDIYYKVGKELYNQNFDFQTTNKKKELVDKALKKYLASKIAEESTEEALMLGDNEEVSVDDLAIMLGDLIPQEQHFDTMRHLTHFVLKIAGEMQGWSVIWWEEKDIEFIDNPLIEFNKGGKIESLKTHENTSYVQTFRFVYDVYKNTFMEKEVKNKHFALKNNRIGSKK